MAVKTMKKPTAKPDAPRPILDDADHIAELVKAGMNIEETCYMVDLEVSWFSGTAAARGEVAEEMMEIAEAEKDTASISTRLFSCKHPRVEKCEAAKRALYAYRDMCTFPLAKVAPFLTTENAKGTILSTQGGSGVGRRLVAKDAGIRVIAREKLDGFIEQIRTVYGPAVMAAVSDLNAHLAEVLEFEKNRQGRLFRVENYPKEIHASIRVMPRRIGLGINFEQHCPQAASLLKETAQKQLSDTVELAVADFVDSFLGCVKTVANQLGYRTRIYPDAKNVLFAPMKEAEVVSMLRHADDPEIPEGSMDVEFRFTPEGLKKSTTQTMRLTEAEFKALNPKTTEERKKVVQTSLDGFLWQLDRYREISEHLGEPGKKLGEIVNKARDVFQSAGDNNEQMLKEMRDSSFFRKKACSELGHVKDSLQDLLINLPAYKGKRRAVGKLADAED